ncbi:hypothetical protein LTR85_005679 [Meristemomyces frigidus]|nr:hypothetical protein LTR85_005679 [Meristemomyces frigidus]
MGRFERLAAVSLMGLALGASGGLAAATATSATISVPPSSLTTGLPLGGQSLTSQSAEAGSCYGSPSTTVYFSSTTAVLAESIAIGANAAARISECLASQQSGSSVASGSTTRESIAVVAVPTAEELSKRQGCDVGGIWVDCAPSPTPGVTPTISDTYDPAQPTAYSQLDCKAPSDVFGVSKDELYQAIQAYCGGLGVDGFIWDPRQESSSNTLYSNPTLAGGKKLLLQAQYNMGDNHVIAFTSNDCVLGFSFPISSCPSSADGTPAGGNVLVTVTGTDGNTGTIFFEILPDWPPQMADAEKREESYTVYLSDMTATIPLSYATEADAANAMSTLLAEIAKEEALSSPSSGITPTSNLGISISPTATTTWDTYNPGVSSVYTDLFCHATNYGFGAKKADVIKAVGSFCEKLNLPIVLDATNDRIVQNANMAEGKMIQFSISYFPADNHATRFTLSDCLTGFEIPLNRCPSNFNGDASGGDITVDLQPAAGGRSTIVLQIVPDYQRLVLSRSMDDRDHLDSSGVRQGEEAVGVDHDEVDRETYSYSVHLGDDGTKTLHEPTTSRFTPVPTSDGSATTYVTAIHMAAGPGGDGFRRDTLESTRRHLQAAQLEENGILVSATASPPKKRDAPSPMEDDLEDDVWATMDTEDPNSITLRDSQGEELVKRNGTSLPDLTPCDVKGQNITCAYPECTITNSTYLPVKNVSAWIDATCKNETGFTLSPRKRRAFSMQQVGEMMVVLSVNYTCFDSQPIDEDVCTDMLGKFLEWCQCDELHVFSGSQTSLCATWNITIGNVSASNATVKREISADDDQSNAFRPWEATRQGNTPPGLLLRNTDGLAADWTAVFDAAEELCVGSNGAVDSRKLSRDTAASVPIASGDSSLLVTMDVAYSTEGYCALEAPIGGTDCLTALQQAIFNCPAGSSTTYGGSFSSGCKTWTVNIA